MRVQGLTDRPAFGARGLGHRVCGFGFPVQGVGFRDYDITGTLRGVGGRGVGGLNN